MAEGGFIVIQKVNKIKASDRIKYLTLLVSALTLLVPILSHGFEFSGIKWKQSIRYYYMEGCPAYVLPAFEAAFNTVSPIPFQNTGVRFSVGFDHKVTLYCADSPNDSLQQIPSNIESADTHFSTEEQTIGATTRRYWNKTSLEIVDFDIWLNTKVITPENIDKILKHEVLHGLGISHSNNPDALMYFKPTRSKMHADDLAALSILYEICEDSVDDDFNLFVHKLSLEGERYYGILPFGGIWPDDIHTIGLSPC
jgi:hypothetical protein